MLGFLKELWGNRLARTMVIWLLVMNAALSVIVTGIQLYAGYGRLYEEMIRIAEEVELGFKDSIAGALRSNDFRQVELLLDGLESYTDVAAARVTARDGRVWGEAAGGAAEGNVAISTALTYESPVDGAVTLGELTFFLTTARIWDEIYAQILVYFTSTLAKVSVASVLMLVIFRFFVSSHLRRIAEHVADSDWMAEQAPLTLFRSTPPGGDDLEAVRIAVNEARARVLSEVARRDDKAAARQRMVLDKASNGVIGFDAEGRIVIINRAARAMLGAGDRDDAFPWPKSLRFLRVPDGGPLPEDDDPIRRSLAGEAIQGETLLLEHAVGVQRYVKISSTPTEDPAQPIATVVVIDDVTENEVNRQKAERASRLDALGQLTGGVAHDFNNLLATVTYALELAKRGEVPPRAAAYIETAQAAVSRGSNLTNRLLTFAKSKRGAAASHAVRTIFGDVRVLARPTIEETIELAFEEEDEDLFVFCDGPQLENALLNLLLNARDAIVDSGRGDKITISARSVPETESVLAAANADPDSYVAEDMRREHDASLARADGKAFRYVEIAIKDNGPGMSPAVKQRAIDPFFSTKNIDAGTGLGLSMVFGFTQQSAGELKIYSEEGHGATIRLTLPRGDRGGAREARMGPPAAPKGGGRRILVVEDEPPLLDMMEDLLQSMGYEVIKAGGGREALAMLGADRDFDLLLTDVVLPGGVSGFELARVMRDARPDLAIVYMSGYAGFSETDMKGVVAPLVRKPCPAGELAGVVQLELSRRAAPRE